MKKIYHLFFIFLSASTFLQAQDDRLAPGSGFQFKSLLPNYNKPVITTEFANSDTNYVMSSAIGDSIVPKNIFDQPKSVTGAYILCPGFYQMVCKSYCIKAGTYGPSQGDAYLYAPLEGPKANLMKTILVNAEKKGNYKQEDIQMILWSIISKSKFKDLNPHLQVVVLSLLGPKELVEFNNGAIGFIPERLIQQALLGMPPAVQKIISAENEMRRMFSMANITYQEVERMAVITGSAPIDRPQFKRGRWSRHPLGYYIRYLPSPYRKTVVQVIVPPAPKEIPNEFTLTNINDQCNYQVEFNAIGSVAVPSNTGSQRLLQSNEIYKGN